MKNKTYRFIKLILKLLIHFFYKVKVVKKAELPKTGAALLISNHVSFLDWLFIIISSDRPIRFVMYHTYFEIAVVRYFTKKFKCIPIASKSENPELVAKAFDKIDTLLREGEIVCIFPEGKLTADGSVNEFKPGILKILKRTSVPVYPMALQGLWNSKFTHSKEKTLIRSIRPNVQITIGKKASTNLNNPEDFKNITLSLMEEFPLKS
jgi:1-acyl-sn-glycerol-3-phosphate acyltransferase